MFSAVGLQSAMVQASGFQGMRVQGSRFSKIMFYHVRHYIGPEVCRIMAFCRYWVMILSTLRGLGRAVG